MKTNSNKLKVAVGMISVGLLSGCVTEEKSFTGAIQTATNAIDNLTGKSKGATVAARFEDSAVENLQFKSASNPSSATFNGLTGTGGTFYCASGDVVEFFIGTASLGTSICQSVVTPQTLAAVKTQQIVAATTTSASGTTTSNGNTLQTVSSPVAANDVSVLNRVRLLMTLDADSDPANGIQLPSKTEQDAITTTFTDADFKATDFDTKALTVVQAMTSTANRSLTASADAQAHFNNTIVTLGVGGFYNTATGAYDEYDEVAAAAAAAAAAGGYGNGGGDD